MRDWNVVTPLPRDRERVDWPAPLDLHELAEHEPAPPRDLLLRWLPRGEVALLAGHGGSGKSQIALHLAACNALGVPWCGIQTKRRRVVFLSAEDGGEVMHWRLARICRHLDVTLDDLAENLRIIDASNIDAELVIESGRGEEPIVTAAYTALGALVAEVQASRDETTTDSGVLLVLDGASDLYGASEIVRRHVRRFIRLLRRLVGADGAVLLLAHVDKAAARNRDSPESYSGSTAWHNSVRARWALRSDGDDLTLALEKANHAKAGAEIRLRWDAEAHLYIADQAPADGGVVASIRERAERDGVVAALKGCAETGIVVPAAMSGPRTAFHVLASRPEMPEALRGWASRRRFWALIEELRQSGALVETEHVKPNRHKTMQFVLATEGKRQCAE